jgi:hypothetical protein
LNESSLLDNNLGAFPGIYLPLLQFLESVGRSSSSLLL